MMALAETADPGNRYGVPYLWSVTGLGYNTAMLDRALGPDAPHDSLALVFDPEIAAKLDRYGIEIVDTPQEVMPAALNYLGLDHRSRDVADLDRAAALLEKVRPHIRRFHSSQYINDLAAGDICLALGYSGDVIQARNRAREAGSPVEIAFRAPREGAQMSIDMLAIPKDAPAIPTTRINSSITSCAPKSSRRSPTRSPIRTRTWRRPRWSIPRSATTPASTRRTQVMQLLYLDAAGAARLRAARARALWNRDQVGLLSRPMALLEIIAASKSFRRRPWRSTMSAWTSCAASCSRCSAVPAAAKRRCFG